MKTASSSSSYLLIKPDGLIPAAMRDKDTRGRRFDEPEHPYRSRFQRDRDRVIHSAHFRRLEYKTQVFVNGEGDNYRTRLTHTLEVTQIARSIARALGVNEDLAEAAALSHDLGHTAFGHAGERVLNGLMENEGGFNHNAQGLRIVDILETRYASFPGLNLTFEVREAFVRHGGPRVAAIYPEYPYDDAPLLEVAATLVADDIAYIAHDIDDGLFSGLLEVVDLEKQDLWREATEGIVKKDFPLQLKRTEGVRRLINLLVSDVLKEAKTNIVRMELDSPDKVRAEKNKNIIFFSNEVEEKKESLKKYLFRNFYRHPTVMEDMEEAQGILRYLWDWYVVNYEKMPSPYRQIADTAGVKRAATDYVSGMTDRYAREKWQSILLEK